MVDARHEAVLVAEAGRFVDKTREVVRYQSAEGRMWITYAGGRRYPYGHDRVRILGAPVPVELHDGQKLEVDGEIWDNASEIRIFRAAEGEWAHVFYRTAKGEDWSSREAPRIRIVTSAATAPEVADVLDYWRNLVSRLDPTDPLRPVYESLRFIHPESVLAQYVAGASIQARTLVAPPIYPFRSNLSQQQAVEHALTHSISVIEGPPGTGKTETILNVIANVIVSGAGTVGVVAYGNSAVDNVREKLDELGFGHVVARLGRKELVESFLQGQQQRNERLAGFVRQTPSAPPYERLAELDASLRRLRQVDRDRARRRQELGAYALELRHFEKHLQSEALPELDGFPLLRRSSGRILDYLAESAMDEDPPGIIRRIRRYLRYGSLRGLDPQDTVVVLRLQRAFYDRRIAELTAELSRLEAELSAADFDRLGEEHRQLSIQALHAALGERYVGARTTYDIKTYRRRFADFTADYPVLLSTCHALRGNLPAGHLLDYLVIDEASQVDLLAAGAVLGSCRNLIVVGDPRQLAPILDENARAIVAPRAAYGYQHSILSSLTEVYPDLPRTLLREHYRCDPAIIGFCNKAFYAGDLIPFSVSRNERPLVVWRTTKGNHARQHMGGGRSNQREVDTIVEEVIPHECAGLAPARIGITTPYRRQADKVTAAFIDTIEGIQSDTVHRYQGRQKDVMIMTTVLDETWRSRAGLRFVDDPQLINVAVSRAVRKFVLVTDHDGLPKSRYVRDLIDYIGYQTLDTALGDSQVISVFDLLYRDYDERLRALGARLRNDQKYRSENIVSTLLRDLLAEEQYQHLTVVAQVLLRNLVTAETDLTPTQAAYVAHRASVDFVVYNRISNRPALALEVDGFAYHENKPEQLKRDALKDEILRAHRLPLLRLPTTGSAEEAKIRAALDGAAF